MKPLLGGTVFEHSLAGWHVSWESRGDYRHWCVQSRPDFDRHILVVMKNPGSLSGDGANLRRDTTLRILRVVGNAVGLNQTVINLFDYASPKLEVLHSNWDRRDGSELAYRKLDTSRCRAVLFAYGDLDAKYRGEYSERIELVRQVFSSLPEIRISTTKAGNPVHPMNWQRNKLMSSIIAAITDHFKA